MVHAILFNTSMTLMLHTVFSPIQFLNVSRCVCVCVEFPLFLLQQVGIPLTLICHCFLIASFQETPGWGNNDYGQLGDGTQKKRRTPSLTTLPGDARAVIVTAGSYHSLVLTNTGEVLAAGKGLKRERKVNNTRHC